MARTVFAIIPTYNEVDLVRRCVGRLAEEDPTMIGAVINAGEAIGELPAGFREIRVTEDYFWTKSVNRGLEEADQAQVDAVLLMNADTWLIPGSLEHLWCVVESSSNIIAVSPAYEPADPLPRLLYSRQSDLGILLYGKIRRDWETSADAPKTATPTDVIGGQGVLIPVAALRGVRLDEKNFPQYASDHDLWYQLRKAGWRLVVACAAGIVNERQFNSQRRGSLAKLLLHRMTSEFAPESARIMWRLRRKHLALPIAVISWVVAFTLRWTLGLPKILRRSR